MFKDNMGPSSFFTEDMVRAIANTFNNNTEASVKSEAEEAAKTTKMMYDAFISAGFNENQVTKLIVAFVSGVAGS